MKVLLSQPSFVYLSDFDSEPLFEWGDKVPVGVTSFINVIEDCSLELNDETSRVFAFLYASHARVFDPKSEDVPENAISLREICDTLVVTGYRWSHKHDHLFVVDPELVHFQLPHLDIDIVGDDLAFVIGSNVIVSSIDNIDTAFLQQMLWDDWKVYDEFVKSVETMYSHTNKDAGIVTFPYEIDEKTIYPVLVHFHDMPEDSDPEEVLFKATHDVVDEEDDSIFYYGVSRSQARKMLIDGDTNMGDFTLIQVL